MVCKKEHIKRLQLAIRHLHGCDSLWERTETIEADSDPTLRQREIEVFRVNHPDSGHAYGWRDSAGNLVAILDRDVGDAKAAVFKFLSKGPELKETCPQ
jgi:hypothetical protein